jgi:hypothetical protein
MRRQRGILALSRTRKRTDVGRRGYPGYQVLPNPYFRVLWNIRHLRRKKFGKRFFRLRQVKINFGDSRRVSPVRQDFVCRGAQETTARLAESAEKRLQTK